MSAYVIIPEAMALANAGQVSALTDAPWWADVHPEAAFEVPHTFRYAIMPDGTYVTPGENIDYFPNIWAGTYEQTNIDNSTITLQP